MRRHRTLANMMLGTAVVLACMLAPASGIATEPLVNFQLLQAAKNGELDWVKTLLAQGADVNAEVNGRTVLMWAVDPQGRMRALPMLKESYKKAYWRSVNRDLVKFLVDQGADVNAKDSGGYTALMCVAQMADLAIVKYLVDKGADVNARGVSRHYAVESGRNMFGPCIRQVHTVVILAAESGNLEIMEFLIDKGADMNVKDDCGCTALMVAARRGNLEAAKFLIRKGADVNVRDKKGNTALMYSVGLGHWFYRTRINGEVVKMLVDKGADLNARDKDGRTALMEAAERGKLEAVKLLIDRGADVNVKDKDGRTALDLARRFGGPDQSKTAEYLKAHGAK